MPLYKMYDISKNDFRNYYMPHDHAIRSSTTQTYVSCQRVLYECMTVNVTYITVMYMYLPTKYMYSHLIYLIYKSLG